MIANHLKLLADSQTQAIFGTITPPDAASGFTQGTGSQGLSLFVTNLIAIIYVVAALVFVFMMIWGGFQWIISGGEKEAIASARKRITYAIIGIVFMALTFVILNFLGTILHFQFFTR